MKQDREMAEDSRSFDAYWGDSDSSAFDDAH
jgi:hypothetical protein